MAQFSLDTKASVVNAPLDLLDRMFLAVKKVHRRMLKTSQALQTAEVPFAVVGGNAVAIWVESVDDGAGRNTRDVDILIRRSDLRIAIEAMQRAEFQYVNVHGVGMFVDRDDAHPARAVHVIHAGERVRPEHLYPAPEITNLKYSPEGVPAIGLTELLTMKLQANRSIDRAHIIDMRNVELITQAVIESAPADLRSRLLEIMESEPKSI